MISLFIKILGEFKYFSGTVLDTEGASLTSIGDDMDFSAYGFGFFFPKWLFPNYSSALGVLQQSGSRISKNAAQCAMKAVVKTCKIKKKYPSILSGTMPPTFLNVA